MDQNNIINNQKLSGISPEKLIFLSELVKQMNGKSQSEILPFLMASMTQAKEGGYQFTDSESNLLLDVLMQGMNEKERSTAEMVIRMLGKK